jgi:photosystem II stability/assembly factor-like uncharacterized protein
MKNSLLFLLLIFFFSSNIHADNWVQISSGYNVIFYGVSFSKSNPDYGYAVGEAGTILGTYDGGLSWWTSNSNVGYWFQSVSTIDNNNAFVVGFDPFNGYAKIFRTTTGGTYWDQLWGNVYTTLNSVSFSDPLHGTAVGRFGTVIRTNDGGVNWTPQTASTYDLQGVNFINNNTGWIVGALGTIRKTTNGGVNWFNQQSPDTNKLFCVSFYNESYGSAVGADGIIINTTDGGFNWRRCESHVQVALNGVSQTSGYNITVVGNMGTIIRSNDGGNSFHIQPINNTNLTLFGVSFMNAYKGVTVGGSGNILRTTNAGGDSSSVIGIRNIQSSVPGQFMLYQNYPNPFNPTTNIRFSIPANSNVSLKIYNILGREISTLINTYLLAGTHEYIWNSGNLNSGIYFYSLSVNGYRQTKKMMLIR